MENRYSSKKKPRRGLQLMTLTHDVPATQKFSPRVNKSFTCYQEAQSSTPKHRSLSVEKHKTASVEQMTPRRREKSLNFRSRNLRSTSKLISGHPGPGDFENSKMLKSKKDLISSWLERAFSEIKLAEYSSAVSFLTKIIKEQPNHVEALYHRAISYTNMSDYKTAIPDLLTIIQDNPLYNRKVYLILSVCFASLFDFDTAIRHLSKGLLKFPKFIEGFVMRGQLYAQQLKWEKAAHDFFKAISLNPTEGSAYLGLGDAYLAMGDKKNALNAYGQVLNIPESAFQGLLRRAKLLFDLQQYEGTLADLQLALTYNPEDPEAYYYKALVLLSKENLIEAALCLEQVIKYDTTEKKYAGAAIYDLGAIKIKQKDYYGAMHAFKRASDLNLEVSEQRVLKGYVEAILSMMKRKFKEGIAQFSRIIKKKHPLIQEYIGNCYTFRGYGHASIEKHELAVKDLATANKIQELDHASQYNLKISTAWIKAEGDYSQSLEILETAYADFPKNIEPLAYQAAIYLTQSRKSSNKKFSEKAKSLLDKAIGIRENDSDLFYFRGLVLYFLEKPIEAVPDFEIAIDKAEDNMPMHFISRGLCYATLKLYKEAAQDFSIAIQLDEKLAEPYYYRGRCAYLVDDTQLAFQDYQKMITNKHEDPLVHVYAGNLLMIVGSIEDACKAFTNANSIKPTAEAFVQRAKCYVILEKPEAAIADFEEALRVKIDNRVEFDLEMLRILIADADEAQSGIMRKLSQLSKILKMHTDGQLFKSKHVHWYKGALYFIIGEYQKAKVEFKASLDTKAESDDPNAERDNAEILYNLALCYIITNSLEAALIHLQELAYMIEGSNRGKVLLLIGILQLAMQDSASAKNLMLEAFKYDSITSAAYLEEKDHVEIMPFNSSSTLAIKFVATEVKITDCHPVYVRPSFALPVIQLPSLEFKVEESILDNFLVKSVKCKPEAPWLNRVKGTIQFTEEIREILSESVETTVKSDNESDGSVFDESYSEVKTFRSMMAMPIKEIKKHDTAELLNFIKKSEVIDTSEEVS